MKKRSIILLSAIGIMLSNCTNELESDGLVSTKQQTSNTRTLNEALSIAQQASQLVAGATTRSATARTIDMSSIQYVLTPSTRTVANADTLLYIINYSDNQGFAVVSAKKSTEGLLAVTEQGNYSSDENNENGGFNNFMQQAKNYVASSRGAILPGDDGGPTIKEYNSTRDTIDKKYIAPKLTVKWGQTGVEGLYAPNGVAGCVNTALAQIMSHYCYPAGISLTYQGASKTYQSLNWSAMKNHKVVHYRENCNATSDAHEAISQLLRQLGQLTNSEYSPSGTSSNINNAKSAISGLGYTTSAIYNYTTGNFYSALSSNKLIYMRGGIDKEEGEEGHAWVVDGMYEYTVHYVDWVREIGQLNWTILSESYDTKSYMHINWGWDGDCNGLFRTGVFQTNRAQQYDNPNYSNNLDYDFTLNHKYFEISR